MKDKFWIGFVFGIPAGILFGLMLAIQKPNLVLEQREWSAVLHERYAEAHDR